MACLKLTLPDNTKICNGKQITFKAPCNSKNIEGIIINEQMYYLIDAAGVPARSKTFSEGHMTSVILDTERNEAILVSNVTGSFKYEVTLYSSNWQSEYYHLNDIIGGISENTLIELIPSPDITVEQLEALQSANIIGCSQSDNLLVLKAMGDIPTIDIPIVLIVRGDL